jgi:hypothetical protein
MTVVVNRREIDQLQSRIPVLERLAHALTISDPDQIAVVQLEALWTDDNRWKLYLPRGNYRVCVATRDIKPRERPPARNTAPLKSGTHQIELEFRRLADRCPIRVTADGDELIALDEARDWGESGNSSGAGLFQTSTQSPVDQPVVLYNRVYMVGNGTGGFHSPDGPGVGLLLWIERVADKD